jgi:hypothetical protein
VPHPPAGGVDGERGVGFGKRLGDVRVVRRLDTEPHELEEAGVDDGLVEVDTNGVAEVALGLVVGVAVVVDTDVVAVVTVGSGGREQPLLGAALPLVGDAQP